MKVDALDHLVLTVMDIDITIAFYRDVLGMRAEVFQPPDGTRRRALEFGAQKINLHQKGAEFEPKAGTPTPGSADLCFFSQNPQLLYLPAQQLCFGPGQCRIGKGY